MAIMEAVACFFELLEPLTEDDMIAAFLAAEVDSRRFGGMLLQAARAVGCDEATLRNRGTSDPHANALRARLLEAYRGWGSHNSVFGGLPTESIAWWRAQLSHEALRCIDVIKYALEIDPRLTTRRLTELRDQNADAADEADMAAVVAFLSNGRSVIEPILIAEPSLTRFVI